MLDPLETKNFICSSNHVGPPRSLEGGSFDLYSKKQPQAPWEPGSEPVPKARGAPAWARRVARLPGKGHPTKAGSAERSVRDREGREHLPPSFLPNPILSPLVFPGILRIPQPSAAALTLLPSPTRPCLGSPPSPAPASSPSSPTSPRGPPRLGPLPLVAAAAPFTIALPASLLWAPGSLPPAALSAHARSGRRRLRRLRFFLKGNAEEPRVTVGEGDPEPRRPPREAADPPSRSRRALGGPVPPTPSRGGAKGGKWRLGAAEASSGAGGRGGEGGVRGGETRRARPGQGGPKRAPGMSSGAAGCELLPLRRRRRWRQQRRRRGHHGSTAGLSRGLHFSARRRDGARASEKPR